MLKYIWTVFLFSECYRFIFWLVFQCCCVLIKNELKNLCKVSLEIIKIFLWLFYLKKIEGIFMANIVPTYSIYIYQTIYFYQFYYLSTLYLECNFSLLCKNINLIWVFFFIVWSQNICFNHLQLFCCIE